MARTDTANRSGGRAGAKRTPGRSASEVVSGDRVPVDPYRAFVFPNRIRDERRGRGFAKLLGLSACVPEIPYIRLSKIERGEVFARAEELVQIAKALSCEPDSLLIDVGSPDFEIADWAEPFLERGSADLEAERQAVLLAAALREKRSHDRHLTMASLDKEFGLPPVIVSRIENAQKTPDRWNAATMSSLCRLFGVADRAALAAHVQEQHDRGVLGPFFADVGSAELRATRTRERVAAIRADLAAPEARENLEPAPRAERRKSPRGTAPLPVMLPVYGAAMPGGLVAHVPTGSQVPAPAGVGLHSFALRVCRPTLGAGLPGSAILIVDPDRQPSGDGIAVVREGPHYRILAIMMDRSGTMVGYSAAPELEVAIDTMDPADVAAVTAAIFV